jgi:hypothetical protein
LKSSTGDLDTTRRRIVAALGSFTNRLNGRRVGQRLDLTRVVAARMIVLFLSTMIPKSKYHAVRTELEILFCATRSVPIRLFHPI